jgi:DNA-binding CsgD family transcriptional regulator
LLRTPVAIRTYVGFRPPGDVIAQPAASPRSPEPPSRAPALLGRDAERDLLDGVLAAARDGLSGVLVLRGEPGIGKTALLDYAAGAAADLEIARIEAIESEMALGFAGLHQLLLPFADRIGTLPPPQRDALSSAFGLGYGAAPDRFLVALATLTLLARTARPRGLLCVVDDAQWLDRESAAVLTFVARRLHADSIAMLFAVRDPWDAEPLLADLPGIQLTGLPAPAAGQLLRADVPGLDDQVGERIVAETGGNPLALIEVGRELTPGQLSGREPLPELLPLGRQLEDHFLRQARALPADTQTLLLTAAADPTGDPALLWRTGHDLGFGPASAAPAQAENLIVVGAVIRFRHPLIRSAIYYSAAPIERRRIHRALAAATDPGHDPDRRAWHLSEATAEPDESVAAGLERAAERATTRGGWAASAAFLARAAVLTPDPGTQGRRLLAAARAEIAAGAPDKAQLLLDRSRDHLADRRQEGLAKKAQGAIYQALNQPAEAAAVLLAAAGDLAGFDVRLARAALLDALTAATISGPLALDGATVLELAAAARNLPLTPARGVPLTAAGRDVPPAAGLAPGPGDLLLDAASTLVLDGHRAAAPLARAAIAAVKRDPSSSAEMLGWLGVGCYLTGALGDDAGMYALARRLERQARRQGALTALATALMYAGTAQLFAGSLDAAQACFTERGAIEAARDCDCTLGNLMVLAWRGREAETRAEAGHVTRAARRQGQGWRLTWAESALCVLELSLGHYADALASSPRAFEENLLVSAFALPDFIEAAVRSGHRAAGQEALNRITRQVPVGGAPMALGLLARSRALLARDFEADALYTEAIDRLTNCPSTVQLARTQLLYGEWLRRRKRRAEARQQLRAAHAIFEAMGAVGFAERTRLELIATGETARKRSPETRNQLTPQEAQIASLASRGATNPEIASKLFISPNTVDYHLRKVFRKLDVTSRRHLTPATLASS